MLFRENLRSRALMETACSMMSHAHLPDSYWAEAVATAAYVRNRVPTTAIKEDVTPYERWCGRKPNLAHLRVRHASFFCARQEASEGSLLRRTKPTALPSSQVQGTKTWM